MSDVEAHFDAIAPDYDGYKARNAYYYEQVKRLLAEKIPPGSRVIEVGCGTGDLLAFLLPVFGLGIDISPRMVELAVARQAAHGERLRFLAGDVGTIDPGIVPEGGFDHAFMVDVVEHLEDPAAALAGIARLMNDRTRLLVTFANPLWEPILMAAEKLGLKMPEGPHRRISRDALAAHAATAGLREVERGERTLLPKRLPLLSEPLNRTAHRLPLVRRLCLIQFQLFVKG